MKFIKTFLFLLFLSARVYGDGQPVVDAKTESIIRGSLKYLASRQTASGAFEGETEQEKRHIVAMTAYVLMAFQASGNLPGQGEYGQVVEKGLQFLLDMQQADGIFGDRNNDKYMYHHGIASIAVGELYGESRSPLIRAKLEKAIKVILSSQNQDPNDTDFGGWRYRPIVSDADVSVTVLQVVALRAAKNGGLEVPQKTIDNAVVYIRRCFDKSRGGFLYRPQDRGKGPGFARTAAAIYSLQVCGHYEDPLVKVGADYLLSNKDDRLWYTYGNFYAAPAMFMLGGQFWISYYNYTRNFLLKHAVVKGQHVYWEPNLDHERGNEGPMYNTAVYAKILAMPYHYIPLYQR
jgi:hypothetical protein